MDGEEGLIVRLSLCLQLIYPDGLVSDGFDLLVYHSGHRLTQI